MSALDFMTKIAGVNKVLKAIQSSTGAADANKILATGSDGYLDPTFLPPGVGLDVKTLPCSEDLDAGDFVNIWDNAGVATCRKADASSDKPAQGFVLAGNLSGSSATVYVGKGKNTQLTGLVPGTRYFLSATTPGSHSATPPADVSGNLYQILGFAVSATELLFEYDDPTYIV